ncbi:MAG: galactokinase [Chitinophagaceae bacterium]
MIDKIRKNFFDLFEQECSLFAAPGRVNLIGEHTDYNDGFVLPAAIDKRMIFALASNGSSKIRIHAVAYQETLEFNLSELHPFHGWANYLLGVVFQFQQRGCPVKGFDCLFDGDIPSGAGLSSSAALECGLAFGLDYIFGFGLEKFELARIGQMAEHQFVGVKCGIMDQFASMFGKQGKLVRLDCRSLEYSYIPFDFLDYRIVLCNTLVKHSLANSAYNERRLQCEEGVRIMQASHPEIINLRDVDLNMMGNFHKELPAIIFQRCSYVVEENDRLLRGCSFLNQGNLQGFGQLMYQSHLGLSKKYEVSCPELDFLVTLAKTRKEVAGARMMGGGFGGCTINLVLEANLDSFIQYILEEYPKKFDQSPEIYITRIEDGARLIPGV